MFQLGELAEQHDAFRRRGVGVLAIDQEGTGEEDLWRLVEALDGDVPFHLAIDPGRRASARFERVTTYLLDAEGLVVEVFPVHRRVWMPWEAVLARVNELE